MKLNLHIIKDELAGLGFEGLVKADRLSFGLEHVEGCEGWPEQPSSIVVLVIRASDLPREQPRGARLSILCIGQPTAEWRHGYHDVIWTTGESSVLGLANEVSRVFAKYDAWDQVLQAAATHKAPLQKAVEATGKLLSNPFAAFSTSYRKLFEWYPDIDEPSEEYRRYREAMDNGLPYMADVDVNSIVTDEFLPEFVKTSEPTIVRLNAYDYPALLYNVSVGGVPCITVGMDGVIAPFTNRDFSIVKHFGDRLSDMLTADEVFHLTHPEAVREALSELIAHRLLPPEQIAGLLDHYGWGERDNYCVLVAMPTREKRSDEILEQLALSMSRLLASDCYLVGDGCITFAINLTERQECAATVRSRIGAHAASIGLVACLSTAFDDFKDLYYYYQQARVSAGLMRGEADAAGATTFDEHAVDYICERMVGRCGPSKAEALVPEGLRRLIDHDRQKGTDYARSLGVYLRNERNVAKTVRQEFIHRNTFAYRLQRIEEISALNLDDPDVRLWLLMAFSLLEREKTK